MTPNPGERAARITSARNPLVVDVQKLHRTRERRRTGLTILEGPHLLSAALEAGSTPEFVLAVPEDDETLAECAARQVVCHTVDKRVLGRVAPTEHPRGPVAVIQTPPPEALAAVDMAVLVGISDPGNAGTLIRSAAAFGFNVAVVPGSVDVWSPKVLRSGAGAHFLVGISMLGDDWLHRLATAGATLVATAPGGEPASVRTLGSEGAVALLIGNEPHGLGAAVITASDVRVGIPTERVESLNAAVAGSILMYARAGFRGSGKK